METNNIVISSSCFMAVCIVHCIAALDAKDFAAFKQLNFQFWTQISGLDQPIDTGTCFPLI